MGLRVLGFRVLGFRVWVFGSRLGFSRLGPSGPLAKKGFRASSAQVTLGFRRFASGASGVLRFFVTGLRCTPDFGRYATSGVYSMVRFSR